MQHALQILGIKCYHAFELYDNLDHCEPWDDAQDAKFFGKGPLYTREDWDKLLGEYGALTDVPAICFSDEFIDLYPEAKVVLVERDIDRWYASFDNNVIKHLYDPLTSLVAALDKWSLGRVGGVHYRWAKGWMNAETKEDMQNCAKQFYQDHYAHIREITPKDRLLEYKLGTGWEPLCEFLGRPVPTVPFPRVNEQAAQEAMMKEKVRNGMISILYHSALYGGPLLAAGLAWKFYA